ncbi:MAG: SRPBCC family protein [Candidatus Thorarchaeota archaeon]
MQLTITKQFKTEKPVNLVWDFLNDPYKVVRCVPGAKIKEEIDKDNFKGVILIKVGPITTEYNGDAKIELRDKENMQLKLSGQATASKAMGNASMVMTGILKSLDDGGTEVSTSVNATITGRVAQLGSRMIQAVSDRMFDEFVKNFEENIKSQETPITSSQETHLDETKKSDNESLSPNKANNTDTTETEVKPISAFSLISSVTPLWVKILVPIILLVIVYLVLVFVNILPRPF